MFLKLGTINVHHKRNKLHPYCCCHDYSFATGAVLIKTEISSFCFYQERITPHNLLMGVMTTWGLCLFFYSGRYFLLQKAKITV